MINISPRRGSPYILMDKEILTEKVSQFSGFGSKVKTYYSVKANPDLNLLKFIGSLGVGFEIASSNELDRLLKFNVPSRRIISGNPMKIPSFIRHAYKSGIREFVIDSADEIDKIMKFAPGSRVIVRIVTDNSESSWPLTEKFGLPPDEAAYLLIKAKSFGLSPSGVTFHVGSQCTGFFSWTEAIKNAALVWALAEKNGMKLTHLNLGGGFPAKHEIGVPRVEDIMKHILSCVTELFPEEISLSVEPGRALVADAGTLITTVIGTAFREGKNWMYLDSGVFNGLMESVGGITYRFQPLSTAVSLEMDEWILAGPSCDSFDVIARGVTLPKLKVGDRISISPAGAYTSAYASNFNGMKIPPVILV